MMQRKTNACITKHNLVETEEHYDVYQVWRWILQQLLASGFLLETDYCTWQIWSLMQIKCLTQSQRRILECIITQSDINLIVAKIIYRLEC